MKKTTISREQVNAWNRMAENVKGTSNYYIFDLWHEYQDVDRRWKGLGYGNIRQSMIEIAGEEFFIKKIKGNVWIYWEYRGDSERWLLSDLARAFFNVEEV